MNVSPVSGASKPRSRSTAVIRCGCTLLVIALIGALPRAVAEEPIAAVWQPRKLSFSYSSARTHFSCSALAGRVSAILRVVGARDDIKVKASGCDESGPPSPPARPTDRMTMSTWDPMSDRMSPSTPDGRQYVNLYVQLMLPTEVTPAVLEELKKDKARRELVARVTANPAAKFNDPVMFGADRREVTLSQNTVGLTVEECELLDQMSPSVFRELGMRVVRDNFVCSADSRLPPVLVVETLLPTPYVPAAAPAGDVAPAAGDDGSARDGQ